METQTWGMTFLCLPVSSSLTPVHRMGTQTRKNNSLNFERTFQRTLNVLKENFKRRPVLTQSTDGCHPLSPTPILISRLGVTSVLTTPEHFINHVFYFGPLTEGISP